MHQAVIAAGATHIIHLAALQVPFCKANPPSGAAVNAFKSWATRRRSDPERIVFERTFKHPLISPPAIAAARALEPLQGHHGLYFSGAFTTGADLQETALYSAMKVTEAVAPASRKLASLRARMRSNEIAGISYDL